MKQNSRSPDSGVEAAPNLFDWFDERVKDAHQAVGVELTRNSELYLTNLLVERARADRAEPPETTLAELHLRASGAPPSQQARTYRELGDRSLYRVGYFEESLSRRTVGARYYCEMGSAAYARVDDVLGRWFGDAFDGVFHELAEQFRGCVRVLQEVRHACDDQQESILRMYERWRETGSESTAERLRAHGLVLPHRPQEA